MQSILPKITMATFVFFSFINTQAQTAQKIGDNPTKLDNSAVLEIQSTKKGLLPPRMTEAQRGGINLPATGLVIYNLTSKRLEVWDGAAWSAGDNLGNHTATANLNMGSKNIDDVSEINLKYQMRIFDQSSGKYVSLWKEGGKFKIWDSTTSTDVFFLDETGKTTLTSAAIAKGTDNTSPTTGQVATAADTNGNIVWRDPSTFTTVSSDYTPSNDRDQTIIFTGSHRYNIYSGDYVNGKTLTIKFISSNVYADYIFFRPIGLFSGKSFYVDGKSYNDIQQFVINNNTTVKLICIGNRNNWYTLSN